MVSVDNQLNISCARYIWHITSQGLQSLRTISCNTEVIVSQNKIPDVLSLTVVRDSVVLLGALLSLRTRYWEGRSMVLTENVACQNVARCGFHDSKGQLHLI